MKKYELEPKFDSRKSFYGKAVVVEENDFISYRIISNNSFYLFCMCNIR